MSEPGRCAARSVAREEPMLGTASTIRSWLLLEHPGPWGVVALRDARLPRGLGDELRRRSATARVRVLLIRRPHRSVAGASLASGSLPGPRTPHRSVAGAPLASGSLPGPRTPGRAVSGPPSAFAVRSGPGEPWIERLTLDRVEDAAGIDLDRLGRGERPDGEAVAGPLFLVCTHGRRDPCCAERGRPLAEALAGPFPEATWESSHLGGDRFAGNLLAFPHGYVFGRVGPDAGPAVARAYLDGRLDLDRLRGRTCRPMAIQAAEHLLRGRLGLDGIGDVELEAATRAEDELTGRFRTRAGRFEVRVAIEPADPFALTCRSTREEPPPVYRALGIVRLPESAA